MASLIIGGRTVGDGFPPLMFAEEGQANQGDFSVAAAMCRNAAAAGADGIEFQLFWADDMYIKADPGYQIYRSRELKERQIRELIAIAHTEGLVFQVAGLSPRIIALCEDAGADCFCVNATDLANPLILDAVVKTGKPFWLATLMATMGEIDWSVSYVQQKGCHNFGLLHGQHVMSSNATDGVPPELLQLDCISLFKRRYECVVGFVDHTATTFVPALAVSKGASLVMKHLSPCSDWRGPDWVVCLDPDSWHKSRTMLQYASASGGNSKELSQAEFKDRSIHRRGIYTVRPLPAGHLISSDDLTALRPGKGGMDPKHLQDMVGKKIARDIPGQHQLQSNDILL